MKSHMLGHIQEYVSASALVSANVAAHRPPRCVREAEEHSVPADRALSGKITSRVQQVEVQTPEKPKHSVSELISLTS